ncbi:hypothetical protein BJX63DRAFT_416906 [Aspergillus granulosus]|uniref:Uncharacterized protein n=1 Tax=Aspergillus granulosus TaxID=176169 RepID=A0ABR4GRD3_9EURO
MRPAPPPPGSAQKGITAVHSLLPSRPHPVAGLPAIPPTFSHFQNSFIPSHPLITEVPVLQTLSSPHPLSARLPPQEGGSAFNPFRNSLQPLRPHLAQSIALFNIRPTTTISSPPSVASAPLPARKKRPAGFPLRPKTKRLHTTDPNKLEECLTLALRFLHSSDEGFVW